ncbi:MAG: hypothetical protein JWM11_8082 [Planctomycetaceae bacterium]|nr:hypothetical protein [Planctomycetaceae bacterium]
MLNAFRHLRTVYRTRCNLKVHMELQGAFSWTFHFCLNDVEITPWIRFGVGLKQLVFLSFLAIFDLVIRLLVKRILISLWPAIA